jgi:CRP-like cAMP-binding protein
LERDRHLPIENLLSRKHQHDVEDIATVLEFRRGGSTIFAEGEDAHFVYSIAEGVVRLSRLSHNGRRQVLALLLPGDLFGLPDAGIYVNSAETACMSMVYRLPWQKLRGLMMREPALQMSLLNRIAYDLREAQRRIIVLGQQSTYQRLATLLLDFAVHPSFFDARSGVLTLPLTRFDIADYLGTAPETIARGFARLEREGLVRRLSSRTIGILDMKALRALQRAKRRGGAPQHSRTASEPRRKPHKA